MIYALKGAFALQTNDYNLAKISFESSNQIYIELNKLDALASNYTNLGLLYFYEQDYHKSIEYSTKAAYNFEKVFGKESPNLETPYSLIFAANSTLSNFSEAEKISMRLLDIILKTYGEQHYKTGQFYMNLGNMYLKEELYNDGEKYYTKSLNIFEHLSLKDSRPLANLYVNLGILGGINDAPTDSILQYFDKGLSLFKSFYGEKHPKVAWVYENIFEDYAEQNDLENTLIYCQKAHIANSYQFQDTTFFTDPNPQEIIELPSYIKTLLHKFYAFSEHWNKNKDREDYMKQSLSCLELINQGVYSKIINSGEQIIHNENIQSGINNAAYLGIPQIFYYYEHTKNKALLEDYFYWLERIKSQQLLLASQNTEALNFVDIPDSLIAKEKLLSYKIDSIEKRLFNAFQENDSVSINYLQNEALFDTKRAKEIFTSSLEKNYPKYFQLKYDFNRVKLSELKNHIDANTLYLEISLMKGEVEEDNGLYFLTLTEEEEQVYKVDFVRDLSKKITTFNRLLRSHNLLRADRRRKFIDLSHELYNQFIKPIEHLLESKERLVIVGEGVTHYLPFEVLLKNKEDKPWHELDFLIKDHEISYHYSGTLFARAQEQKTDFDNELLAFAPVFSENDNTLSTLRAGGLVMADTIFRSVEGDNFTPLPYSEKEVKNIQQLFLKSANTNLLLNQSANERNLKAALEENHRFVHIASHSFANIDYPKFSGIACATDTTSTTDDGILYVGEVYNLAVNSDLVVLSSCESGVGKLLGGEGMLGLNRSFVYAGVPNVIFSLWKVYDENTGDLMTEFYKNTLQGQSYSKALRAAKLKMLANPETAAPDIWSAFLLVGR